MWPSQGWEKYRQTNLKHHISLQPKGIKAALQSNLVIYKMHKVLIISGGAFIQNYSGCRDSSECSRGEILHGELFIWRWSQQGR